MAVTDKKDRFCSFSDGILLAAILLTGGFHEYISCALSVAMCVYLLVRIGKTGVFYVRKDLIALSVAVVCFGYGATCLWVIDSGMAFAGFWKFLPLILYLLCLWQENERKALNILPYFGAVLACICAVCMQIPELDRYFSVAGRLAGVFQYPNTFALFLLVCQLLLLEKQQKRIWDYLAIVILVAALLYTGSRTVFVLFLISNAGMLLVLLRKKGRALLLAILATATVVGIVLLLSGNPILQRLLNISLKESTFVGRILYFVDALPLLLKYPFGMGYFGYYYIQNSIQTGVYSVAYIHNDFLQLFLDVGWIPAGFFVFALVRWLFRKDICPARKLIVGTVCLHSLFDFNLQFIGMFLLLLSLTDSKENVTPWKLKNKAVCKGVFAVLTVAGLYMGTALALAHWGYYEAADKLYPYNTQNMLSMLAETEDLEQADALADRILKQNTQHYGAYSVKAKVHYAAGDFGSLIQYKRMAFEKNPFNYEEYEEYCQMLCNGIRLYSEIGDLSSIAYCEQELVRTQELLAANAKRLSKLGSMIADQPVTELSEEMRIFIDALKDNK